MKINILLSNLPARFRWSHLIREAWKQNRFTLADKIQASSWSHNVTAELNPKLPKFKQSGMPKDLHLQDLANQFDAAVEANNIADAAMLLMAIGNREHELLMEMILTE